MKFFLIRHAESTANGRRVWTGQSDCDLSERGAAELKDTVSRWRYPRADIYFSSPLVRCLNSFRIIYGREPDILMPELMECSLGALEGTPYTDISADPVYISWVNEPNKCPAGGESFSQFETRCTDGFLKMLGASRAGGANRAAAMVHGDVMRAILHRFADSSVPHRSWDVPNCCVYELDADRSGRISSWTPEPDFLFRKN